MAALLAAPDPGTWAGRRDRALLHVAVTTGLRASELTGLTCADVHLGPGGYVACQGKGRYADVAIMPMMHTQGRRARRFLVTRSA